MTEYSFEMRALVPEHVLMRELDGEAVILDLDRGHYFGLDGVGTRMWVLLTGSSSIEVAYEALAAEYEVDPAELRQDLNDLVSQLVDSGLLRVVDA